MLTPHDLAVLRAAVTYFEEELGPHGVEAMRPYLDEPPPTDGQPTDIAPLRDLLGSCQVRYACCDLAATQVIHAGLVSTIEAAHLIAETHAGQVVTLLVARDH